MAHIKEERYRLVYMVGNEKKVCVAKSKEKHEHNIEICKQRGYEIVSKTKLYPFSTEKNQHNFELINNLAANEMYDMINGEIPFNEERYNYLASIKDRAEQYFCASLPVAWVDYDTWKDMKELSSQAVLHRQEACIANGRPDLVSLC